MSLDEVAKLFEDEEFTREIDTLDTCLYSSDQDNWVALAWLTAYADYAERVDTGMMKRQSQ